MKNVILLCIVCVLLSIYSCQRKIGSEKIKASSDDLLKDAREYYDSNQFSRAKEQFDLVIKIDTTIGEAYFSRAYCFSMEDNIEKSNLDYMRCINLKYKEESSYLNLGCNYAKLLEDSIALAYFKKVLSINPHNEKAKEEINHLEGK
jgi:tetratricopeptide (TPR) repeat protein